jgi:hypothetical protein
MFLGVVERARETEGRKARPTCVIVAVCDAYGGLTHLALLAITTQSPQADRIALEVSAIECRRADLKQCWVVVDEYTYDIAERSWYSEPDGNTIGRFSKTFMMKIATAFAGAHKSSRHVSRLD